MKTSTTQENTSNIGRDVTLFLIGGGLGAGAALLFTPKTGPELRGDIADKARSGYDGALDIAHRVKDESSKLYHSALDRKDNLLDLAGDAIAETKERVSDAVESGKDRAQGVREAVGGKLENMQDRAANHGRRSSNII